MALYHGTSAGSALAIISTNTVLPSKDGFFYCFDSNKPESLAGSLAFATGDGPRRGSLTEANFFSKYTQLNPDFPNGLKGFFYKKALEWIASSWAKEQLASSRGPLDFYPAVMVFSSHEDEIHRTRSGFVNEVQIPAHALNSMILEEIYFDDHLITLPEIQMIKQLGIRVKPLSECINQMEVDFQHTFPDLLL